MKNNALDLAGTKKPFALTLREHRALKKFELQYKLRFLTKFLLAVMLLYCIGLGATSVYYAYEMFIGERTLESLHAGQGAGEMVPQTVEHLFPFLKEHHLFGIGTTQVLHAVLLFYIGWRCFRRLRWLWRRTPQAKLALKLANRLRELGELDLD